jgi:hypothetical protein
MGRNSWTEKTFVFFISPNYFFHQNRLEWEQPERKIFCQHLFLEEDGKEK